MSDMVSQIAALQDYDRYRDLHWEGSFEDYLEIIRERPEVTHTKGSPTLLVAIATHQRAQYRWGYTHNR